MSDQEDYEYIINKAKDCYWNTRKVDLQYFLSTRDINFDSYDAICIKFTTLALNALMTFIINGFDQLLKRTRRESQGDLDLSLDSLIKGYGCLDYKYRCDHQEFFDDLNFDLRRVDPISWDLWSFIDNYIGIPNILPEWEAKCFLQLYLFRLADGLAMTLYERKRPDQEEIMLADVDLILEERELIYEKSKAPPL